MSRESSACLKTKKTEEVVHLIDGAHLCKPLHSGLNRFRLDGSYCDVTIHVDNRAFKCHRAVLASVCKYFHDLFSDNFREGSSRMKNIPIRDNKIEADSFEILLKYFYLGCLPECNEDVIYGLLVSSDFFGLETIKTLCIEFIMKEGSSFSLLTVFELMGLADALNERPMKDKLISHCLANLDRYVQKDFFLETSYNLLKSILQKYRSSIERCIDEDILLDALVRWVLFDVKERLKYFRELINEVDFTKISEDCVEYLLKKYKVEPGTKLESDNPAKVLKKFVLRSFLFLENFKNDDNTISVSYEKPRLENTSSIYVYGRELDIVHYQDTSSYAVFSAREPTETARNSSDLSPNGDRSVKTNWFTSCTFTMKTKQTLVSSGNLIYCLFDSGVFAAYDTVDLSSSPSKQLAPLSSKEYSRSCCSKYTGACATDAGDIYFCDEAKIHHYNTRDEWSSLVHLQTGVEKCSFVAHGDILYAIEGENSEGQILEKYVRAYDRRTSNWVELSEPEHPQRPSGRYYNASCVVDGKIYVYDGRKFKVFDPVAGKWMGVNDGEELYYFWPNLHFRHQLKMISSGEKIFIFQNMDREYLTYDLVTNTVEKSSLFYYCSGFRRFNFENVITFNG